MAPKKDNGELAGKNTEIPEEIHSCAKGCKTHLMGKDQTGTLIIIKIYRRQ